ncbi:hypothetical protein GCM10023187_04550 [Nibrella viscosa]|uniref:MORN repeat variant n=1 Tax=Nibrella viscosa TaxID=1084524 RepID=A0ABP8JUW8_9BACT
MATPRPLLLSLPGLLLVTLLAATPDDRTYGRKERHDFGNRIEEVIYHDSYNLLATVRTYTTDGVLQMEEQFSDYKKRIRSGFTRYWYPGGKLYWTSDFRYNKKHGSFLVYNEDGSLKRREYYKHGVRKKATCYSSSGEVVACAEFLQEAQFTNGPEALVRYVQHYIDQGIHPLRASRLLVHFDVAADGSVENLFFILPTQQGKTHTSKPLGIVDEEEPAFLMDAFDDMPKWKPATFDSIPIRSTVSLSVRYRKGVLSIRKSPDHVSR